jgi:uncharacterized protein YeaO (DUF488 family)
VTSTMSRHPARQSEHRENPYVCRVYCEPAGLQSFSLFLASFQSVSRKSVERCSPRRGGVTSFFLRRRSLVCSRNWIHNRRKRTALRRAQRPLQPGFPRRRVRAWAPVRRYASLNKRQDAVKGARRQSGAEYAARDFFDVWLPILAPSRELLVQLRAGTLSTAAFFRRYRREMAATDARQVIRFVAALAQTTPLSVGCYCEDEAICHRSVLGELIRAAG